MNRSASGAQSSSLAPSVTASWCRTPWLGARRLSSGEPGAGSHDVATDRLVRLAPRLDALGPQPQVQVPLENGRASRRGRVGQSVWMTGGAGSLKKKKESTKSSS